MVVTNRHNIDTKFHIIEIIFIVNVTRILKFIFIGCIEMSCSTCNQISSENSESRWCLFTSVKAKNNMISCWSCQHTQWNHHTGNSVPINSNLVGSCHISAKISFDIQPVQSRDAGRSKAKRCIKSENWLRMNRCIAIWLSNLRRASELCFILTNRKKCYGFSHSVSTCIRRSWTRRRNVRTYKYEVLLSICHKYTFTAEM